MMKRFALTTALAAAAATIVLAQAPERHATHDPDKMVAGGGKLPAGWQTTHTLADEVDADQVRLLINSTEAAAQPKPQIETSRIAGLRINHNLNVQVEGFGTKSAASH